ncbi:MAG: hypothetical protein O2908_05640 [Verrucomicrobia bacterium]|nr:hypothetical protein [Verrucomicrobiota bacterium]MDA0905626.1 hypothetical protein [Verrucomicrobiota bacterium]MDA1078512.1 hypothetical protein [Verrucomicrobiota bacterium]
MKKLFALLLLPSIAFAGKIGENYVGASLGEYTWENINTSNPIDVSGLSFELRANYALHSEGNYGADLSAQFLSANGLDGTPALIEVDITKFDILLRPYYTFQDIKIFANLGLSSLSADASGLELIDENAFLPGVGLEFSIDKISFSPAVNFVDYGIPAEGMTWSLPLQYQINDSIDALFKFEGSGLDDYISSGVRQENELSTWSLGIDYKF